MPNQPLRTVALVSSSSHAGVLDAVLEAGDYDVVFIESIDRAYSQIKRSSPHVIILCVDMDDARCFQTLSILKMDDATSQIPIITYVLEPTVASSHEHEYEFDPEPVSQPILLSMN
jgi:PleD family two-component response regulator